MDTRFFGVLAILLMLFPATLAQSCSAGTPDCCGNSVCDSAKGEDYGTCKTDCTTPKTIEVFIVSPENGAQFVRGDQVTVQARVNADSSKNAQVHQMIAVGKFGLLDMLDDGRHNDEKAGDHLYGNTFGVTEDYQQQQYHLAVQATVVQTTNSASIDYSVSPYLAASIGSTQERFALGDEIVLSGLITKKEKGFETDANLGISFENEKILHAVVTTDAQGRFDYNYQTSTIQPEGEWKITLTVRDENTNFGYYEKKIQVVEQGVSTALSIDYLTETTETHKTGEHVIIEVEVLDALKQKVKDANVYLVPPFANQKEIRFGPTTSDTFVLLYKIPYDLPVGQQRFEIHAQKQTGAKTQTAVYPFLLRIDQSPLTVYLAEPLTTQFAIGDTIQLKAKITYPDNQPVQKPFIQATVNDQPVELTAIEPGLYQGTYTIREQDPDTTLLSISVRDEFDNSGSTRIQLYIKGQNPLYLLSKNAFAVAIAALVIVGGGLFTIRHIRHQKSKTRKQQQKQVIEHMREDLQKRYYVEKLISRETYDRERQQLETKLEKIQKDLDKLEKEEKKTGNAT